MTDVAKRFNELNLEKKSSLINAYGKWIWFTDYNNYRISVYELEGEIVEVWYDVYERAIKKIKIPHYHELDVHLHTIDVQPLLK